MESISSSLQQQLKLFIFVFLSAISTINCQNYQVTFSLMEESDRWTFIGNVSTASGFLEAIPPKDRSHLVFAFLQQTSIKSLLSVHPETGSLYTTVVIDRESIDECKIPPKCVLSFDIAATSNRKESSLFEIISVQVIIEDKNDNAPAFPKDTQVLEISESAVNGSSYLIESAIDEDTGANNSIQYYNLVGNNNVFAINVERKLDESLTVKLIVISKLDREIKDFYNCTIIARDNGNPQRSGVMKINITITDENDNPPILDQTSYNITVKENLQINTGILQIRATDKDIGLNGQIKYRFSPHQSDLSEIVKYFAIDEKTGILRVVNQLVYEYGKVYHIIVEAVDRGEPEMLSPNQAIVEVHIQDTGNNPPTIQINLLSSGSGRVVNVSELSIEGTFVAHVKVEDTDTGQNGNVTCRVDGDMFKIEPMPTKGYKVVVKGMLDREKLDLHSVVVTCQDQGTPVLSSSSSFLVRVTDENDNYPRFSNPTYEEYLYENNDKYEVVVTISARDDDSGLNGDVEYYLGQSARLNYTINPTTGVITTKHVFDREKTPVSRFLVFAKDKGSPALVSNASVIIHIKDRNDNPPEFDKNVFEFNISENVPSGASVDRVIATDKDLEENGIFTFAISDTVEHGLPFILFPDGVIKTNKELNREKKDLYEFTVIAIDKGTPKLTSSALVLVKVLDDNDNSPEIVFPKGANKTFSLPHLAPIGTVITKIRAVDNDTGMNALLSYTISSGNAKRLFQIDLSSGVLSISRLYQVEQDEIFPLIISVYDAGVPQRSVRCDLRIIIKYTNATTTVPAVPDIDSSSNTAIVVVVIVVTLLLSVAIVVVICVIRKFDRDRMKNQNVHVNKIPNNMTEMTENYENGTILSRPYDKVDLPRKKKEVSFSFEDDLDGIDHEISFGNNSVFTDNHEHPLHERQPSQLKTFQLQQSLLTPQPQLWTDGHTQKPLEMKPIGGNPEDNHSDTSRETVTSDSGRGGSEDDLPVSHNNSKEEKDPHLLGTSNPRILRMNMPNKNRRGISPDRTHSLAIDDRIPKRPEKSLSNLVHNEKPKFTVRQPYIDREVRDKKAQSESWVPSYV